MNKIASVIVTYNPSIELVTNISIIEDQVDKIYIIDNGSDIKGKKIINEILIKSNKIEVIYNENNLGIATALNIGCKKAIDEGFYWTLTMDQDSKPAIDMVSVMIDTYNSLDDDEKEEVYSIFPNFVDERVQTIEENSFQNKYEYVDADITSGNLIKNDIFKKVGFFDDELFIDLVDTDFCMKLYKNNYKMIKVRDAILYHSIGEGNNVKTLFGKFNTSNHSAVRRYYMTRNRFYVWERYKDINSFTLKRDKKLFVKEFIKIILGEKDKANKIKMVIKGYSHYKKGIKGKLS